MIVNPMKTISEQGTHVWQFIKFNLVGVMNTLVDIFVFTVLIWFAVHYTIAQCIAYGCGSVNSYIWNKRWTFGQSSRTSGEQMMKFILMNLTVLGISIVLLYITVNWTNFSELNAKLLVTLVTMIINFAGNRLWVFKSN